MEFSGKYSEGVGRRKTATARVRLYPTNGNKAVFIVNDKPLEQYFPRQDHILQILEPLKVAGAEGSVNISVKVRGGGISGQAGAVRHGLARALALANPDLRPILREGGFLTRDPRAKERKKPGLKRARKAPTYTKR